MENLKISTNYRPRFAVKLKHKGLTTSVKVELR